jgi:hypothetical protein
VDVLGRIPSAHWRDAMLRRISDRLGIDEALESDLEQE